MPSYQNKKTISFAVTFVIVNCLIKVQPASAQLLELATSAFSVLNSVAGQPNSPQQASSVAIPQQSVSSSPLSNGKFDVGTENFNGNTINLCISGCLPGGSQPVSPSVDSYPVYPASPTNPVTPVTPASSPKLNNPASATNSISPTNPTNPAQAVQPSSTSSSQSQPASKSDRSQSDKSTNYLPLDFSQL